MGPKSTRYRPRATLSPSNLGCWGFSASGICLTTRLGILMSRLLKTRAVINLSHIAHYHLTSKEHKEHRAIRHYCSLNSYKLNHLTLKNVKNVKNTIFIQANSWQSHFHNCFGDKVESLRLVCFALFFVSFASFRAKRLNDIVINSIYRVFFRVLNTRYPMPNTHNVELTHV